MIDMVIGINILVNDCRNCVPLGPKGDNGAQGAKGDKGQAASSGVKYVRWERPHVLMVPRLSIKVQKDDDFILHLIHVSNKRKIKETRKQKRMDDNISSFSLF